MVGLFYTLKREVHGKSSQVALEELARLFCVHSNTITNDIRKYRKFTTKDTNKNR